ncbi:hypothetical protein ACI2LC_30440 [Nonomuraea wenchangensis]
MPGVEAKGVTFEGVPSLAEVTGRFAEITDTSGAVPGTNPVGG